MTLFIIVLVRPLHSIAWGCINLVFSFVNHLFSLVSFPCLCNACVTHYWSEQCLG